MKKIITLLIFISIFLIGCSNENYIQEQINQNNYCNIDADCSFIGSKCPFGCNIYVNKDKANEIKKLVDDYDSLCVYGCIQTFGVKCENNTCVDILEDPNLCINETTNEISSECEDIQSPKIKNYCDETRPEICTQEYNPVCGWNGPEIQCVKYPCAAEYSNSCTACSDKYVDYWTEGECPK